MSKYYVYLKYVLFAGAAFALVACGDPDEMDKAKALFF